MAEVQTALSPPPSRIPEPLPTRYRRIRTVTVALCAPLQPEDYVVQSMPDASPAKWHLAHTSWFFEQFLLRPMLKSYRAFHPRYEFLFNSYYQTVGPMHQRPHRGLLTRPTVEDVRRYRAHVDEHMQQLLESKPHDEKVSSLVELGLNHEQQHQELLLTDIKHLLSCNPLLPAYRDEPLPTSHAESSPMRFCAFDGGVREIGASGKHFCFDNETPRHRTLIEPYVSGFTVRFY